MCSSDLFLLIAKSAVPPITNPPSHRNDPKMFETLSKAPGDKILALMGEYAADTRPTKIDLGVGVYKDEQGVTAVMSAVRKAEQRILRKTKTKQDNLLEGKDGQDDARVGATSPSLGVSTSW